MYTVSTWAHITDRITVDYHDQYATALFTLNLGKDYRVVMSLNDARDLYNEIDIALRHYFDDHGTEA